MSRKITIQVEVSDDSTDNDVMNIVRDAFSEFVGHRMNGGYTVTTTGAGKYVGERYPDYSFAQQSAKVQEVMQRCNIAHDIRTTVTIIDELNTDPIE